MQRFTLQSPWLRLSGSLAGGLRVIELVPAFHPLNLLAQTPDTGWDTPYGYFELVGGHRLTFAPESPLCYAPPGPGASAEVIGLDLRLHQPATGADRLEREIRVRLDPDRPMATLRHRLTWRGDAPLELALWTVTQLIPGGTAVLPFAPSAAGGPPDRAVVFWSDSSPADPRLSYSSHAIHLKVDDTPAPFKVGVRSAVSELAYRVAGLTFTKRFEPRPELPHPDLGCTHEVYCNPAYVELEALAPLVTLQPGESTELDETWEITPGEGPNQA